MDQFKCRGNERQWIFILYCDLIESSAIDAVSEGNIFFTHKKMPSATGDEEWQMMPVANDSFMYFSMNSCSGHVE